MELYSIGEALIDFLPCSENTFHPVVGGAPANVAACYAKLGGNATFLGKVGDDIFGNKIIKTLQETKVDTSYISKTKKANTALSFVNLRENGEREFSFYRNPSADMFLSIKNNKNINYNHNDILHFCSIDLIDMPIKKATKFAIKKIKKTGGTISFDPNIRKNLWDNHKKYKKTINSFIKYADILKFSEDELEFIFGNSIYSNIADKLIKKGAKIIIFTFGKNGSKCFIKDKEFSQNSFKIKCVDTTGAGDSFIGTFLKYLDIENPMQSLQKAMLMASAVSAIVCTKKGVLSSLPDEKDIINFLGNNKNEYKES